ncbi:hypothetical protein M2G42_21680 [Vibrio vulnificus]|nr:hypothetical protein [Vibrio vulnificus]MCU8496898.1 hypothetical protein [Vibrio vulnificus]MCU8496919.1 hypothetical protein [Vibrio vulnificus]
MVCGGIGIALRTP